MGMGGLVGISVGVSVGGISVLVGVDVTVGLGVLVGGVSGVLVWVEVQ